MYSNGAANPLRSLLVKLALVAGPSTGPTSGTSRCPWAFVSIHPNVAWPIRLRPPSVEVVLDLIDHRCFKVLQQPPGARGSKQQVSLERDRCAVVPRDAVVSGYWELTVARVEKVVIRDDGRHTLKVVERRTGIPRSRRVVSSSTSVGICVYRHSKLESRVHCLRERRRWRPSVVTKWVRRYFPIG